MVFVKNESGHICVHSQPSYKLCIVTKYNLHLKIKNTKEIRNKHKRDHFHFIKNNRNAKISEISVL